MLVISFVLFVIFVLIAESRLSTSSFVYTLVVLSNTICFSLISVFGIIVIPINPINTKLIILSLLT